MKSSTAKWVELKSRTHIFELIISQKKADQKHTSWDSLSSFCTEADKQLKERS